LLTHSRVVGSIDHNSLPDRVPKEKIILRNPSRNFTRPPDDQVKRKRNINRLPNTNRHMMRRPAMLHEQQQIDVRICRRLTGGV